MPDQVERLLADLAGDDFDARRFAVEDLGDLRDSRAVGPLVAVLGEPSAAMREAAVDALRSIGGEATAVALLPTLRSEDVPLRNAASQILQSLGDLAATHLERLLADPDKDVRKYAVDILTAIGSPSSFDAFVAALSDADVNVAAAAAEAVGGYGGTRAVEALESAAGGAPWVRCSVAKSLGRVGGGRAAAALARLGRDRDPMVAFMAAAALKELEAAGPLTPPAGLENTACQTEV